MIRNDLDEIKKIVESIQRFVKEKIEIGDLGVNQDKIDQLSTIEDFIVNINDEDSYHKIVIQLELLQKQVLAFLPNHSPKNFVDDDLKRLEIIYFLLLKTDINRVLEIDSEFLYLTINAMRGVPYSKYLECIDKLTYDELVEIIKNDGATEQSRIVLNTLTDTIINSKYSYSSDILDQEMQEFIMIDVYSRIHPVKTGDYAHDLQLDLQADKSYNLKNIRNARKVNPNIYYNYETKFAGLELYDKMDLETMAKYLETKNYIYEHTGSKAFAMTNLELTLLGIMQYLDINQFSKEELEQIVSKMSTCSYKNYEEVLTQYQIIK